MILKDIRDRLDVTPELPRKEFVIRCYACELFAQLMDRRKLIIFDDAEKLGDITENDLLNGCWDWEMYSSNGESLFWEHDIIMRLFGKKDMTPEELAAMTGNRNLLSLQADALKEAAWLVLDTVGAMR